jgi:catechol 2,3-dioxygenase-like lactoylglutathione lyase family enzyme
MEIKFCLPVIPSLDLEKSIRFWVDGLGFTADQKMENEGRLVGCMVHNGHLYFWLNQRLGEQIPDAYEGIRLYWTPDDLTEARNRLLQVGYNVSAIEEREYGQTEFVMTDDDGYSHCFGVATQSPAK